MGFPFSSNSVAIVKEHWQSGKRSPACTCRILGEVRERDEIENTKLQMQKRSRQGTTKHMKGKGGADIELARLEAKVHRRESRTASKVQVRDMLGEEMEED
jgi:hypothetical protein